MVERKDLKILSAHQPAYLPWLGYLHKIVLADEFIILDSVQFEKNSFTNRNRIKTANGVSWLTVPVLLAGHTDSTVSDIKIDNKSNWREKHWKSIFYSYKKATFFDQYAPFLEDMYQRDWQDLTSLTEHFLSFILKELKINTIIIKQRDLNTSNKKQELILELCKIRRADIFIFGKLGENYVETDLFKKFNITIIFQKFNINPYTQLWGNFVPNLSCLDCLLNIGSQKTRDIILRRNTSKKDLINK